MHCRFYVLRVCPYAGDCRHIDPVREGESGGREGGHGQKAENERARGEDPGGESVSNKSANGEKLESRQPGFDI